MPLRSKATYRKACVPWLALWKEGHREFWGHTALTGVLTQLPGTLRGSKTALTSGPGVLTTALCPHATGK